MPITPESLYNSIESVKKDVSSISTRVTKLESISGIYITNASLQTNLVNLQLAIDDMETSILELETKMQKISLPTDTRYYLEESEITDFRNHFRQLRVMMSDVEKSRQAFIKLASRYNMTNSTL